MRVLLTGGNGFIGSTIVQSLFKLGHDITIVDPVFNEKLSNKITQINEPYTDWEKMDNLLAETDLVIHLAAMLGVDACENSPNEALYCNGISACRFFDRCKAMNVKHVIYTSSSEVYGDIENASEESLVSPKSDYAIAKLYSEKYLKSISSKSFKSHVLRLFSVYGSKQREDFVISRFMKQAMNGKKISIFGEGTQTRAFCHVNDVCRAILLCIDNREVMTENSTLLNIGNPNEPITMKDLALKILEINNLTVEKNLEFISLKKTTRGEKREIFMRTPSIKKAKEILGYNPKIDLNTGLNEFFDNL